MSLTFIMFEMSVPQHHQCISYSMASTIGIFFSQKPFKMSFDTQCVRLLGKSRFIDRREGKQGRARIDRDRMKGRKGRHSGVGWRAGGTTNPWHRAALLVTCSITPAPSEKAFI